MTHSPYDDGGPIDRALEDGHWPKAASMFLKSLGIKGNKYLDAGSRSRADTERDIAKAREELAAHEHDLQVSKKFGEDYSRDMSEEIKFSEQKIDYWKGRIAKYEADLKRPLDLITSFSTTPM
jgi:hypothetical protein